MEKSHLNRDIKRLWKAYKNDKDIENLEEFKKEFLRLYYADRNLEFLNVRSIKILTTLNLKKRFIQLHQWMIGIDEDTL